MKINVLELFKKDMTEYLKGNILSKILLQIPSLRGPKLKARTCFRWRSCCFHKLLVISYVINRSKRNHAEPHQSATRSSDIGWRPREFSTPYPLSIVTFPTKLKFLLYYQMYDTFPLFNWLWVSLFMPRFRARLYYLVSKSVRLLSTI